MIETRKIYWADKIGVVSAFLCMVHCLTVPILLAMGVGFITNPIIACLFILIAFLSIYNVTRGRRSKPLSIFLWLAFSGFLVSIVLEERAEIFEYGMFFFSTAIIIGHLFNMQRCLRR